MGVGISEKSALLACHPLHRNQSHLCARPESQRNSVGIQDSAPGSYSCFPAAFRTFSDLDPGSNPPTGTCIWVDSDACFPAFLPLELTVRADGADRKIRVLKVGEFPGKNLP